MDHLQNFFATTYNDIADKLYIRKGHLVKIGKWLYWILGLLLLVGSCYVLYNRFQKPVAAVLLFMGGWTMLMYYWVKWFKLGTDVPEWPPIITPCPDFLTLYPDNGMIKCVDFVGVAKMSASDPLKKSTPQAVQSTINNPSFYVTFNRPGPSQSFKDVNAKLCDTVHDRGLVWSGVCDEK
jgi:hypothetical protein